MSIFSKFDLEQKREELRKAVVNPAKFGEKLFRFLDNFNVVGSHKSENEINYIWSGTQAQYDNLSEVRDDTVYLIE